MTPGPLFLLGVLAVLVLAAGAAWGWHRRGVRRQQRLASWNELCLRLELAPQPGEGRVAAGQLPDVDFQLHDTGSEWLVAVPLPGPLLPRGVVLLSPNAWRPRAHGRLYPLWWGSPASRPPEGLGWYADWQTPASKVEAPQPFLEQAARAARAHAPLRVEQRRIIQSLRVGAQLSVSEVREAARALDATARGWLEVARSHGLPKVEALNWPSVWWLLQETLRQRHALKWLRYLNLGVPVSLGALIWGKEAAFFGVLALALLLAWRSNKARPFGVRGFALCALMLVTTFVAPWYWMSSVGRGTTPAVIPVRDAANSPHRRAEFFRFRDAVILEDLRGRSNAPVPVLPVDWKPGELVTVWATRIPPESQASGTLGGIVVDRGNLGWYRSAAIKQAQQHGFPTHSHAVFVDFSTHPDTEVLRLRLLALLLWGVPNVLWLGWVLFQWRQKIVASRGRERLRLVR
jgi:hypothetical protein